jgi:hypothetical protein
MLALFYGLYNMFSFFSQMGFLCCNIYSICLFAFIDKNINVYPLYKHSNVPTIC